MNDSEVKVFNVIIGDTVKGIRNVDIVRDFGVPPATLDITHYVDDEQSGIKKYDLWNDCSRRGIYNLRTFQLDHDWYAVVPDCTTSCSSMTLQFWNHSEKRMTERYMLFKIPESESSYSIHDLFYDRSSNCLTALIDGNYNSNVSSSFPITVTVWCYFIVHGILELHNQQSHDDLMIRLHSVLVSVYAGLNIPLVISGLVAQYCTGLTRTVAN